MGRQRDQFAIQHSKLTIHNLLNRQALALLGGSASEKNFIYHRGPGA
jgi:hypothetical protein